MSSVEDATAQTPHAPVVEEPKLSPEERAARRRHRFGLAAAGGAVLLAAAAFVAIVVQAHVAEAERADPFAPRPVPVRKVAAAAAVLPDKPAREPQQALAVATVEEVEKVEAPDINDPRWARSVTGLSEPVRVQPSTHGAAAFAAIEQMRRGYDGSAEDDDTPDQVETAAIDPGDARPVEKAEPKTGRKVVASSRPAQRLATVMADVRLRAGPSDGSAILGVVKSGTDVGIVACDGWCEVIAGDKRGFIYKRFVGQAKAIASRTTAREPEARKAPVVGRNPVSRTPAEIGP